MKNNRFEITIVIALFVITFIVYFGYQALDLLFNGNKFTFITNPFNIINCKKDKCTVDTNYDKYLKDKYYVYTSDDIVKNASISYDESNKELSVTLKKEEIVSPNENYLISKRKNITFYSINKEEMTESEIASINLKGYDTVIYAYKVNVDIDNDGVVESLCYLKSYGNNGYYSALAYKKGGYIEKIDEQKEPDSYSMMSYNITNIIDMGKDKNLEMIVTKVGYDAMDYCTIVYKLEEGSYKALNECEIVSY